MAGLELAPPEKWTAAQTRAQFEAISRLRWRIFVNAFRRKGGAGELVSRIILYVFFAGFAFGVTFTAGLLAFLGAWKGHLNWLDMLLWGTFLLCQLTNIQLGQPGTTFDPTQLIRFPMRVGNYIAIRLFFGLLTPANVIGALISLAIALGITIALPSLWFYALLALAVFAIANALFSRMVFAWIDRWLSTRRAREVFTGFLFAFSLGIQYLNFTFNPAYNHHHQSHVPLERLTAALHLYHRAQPYLAKLPPGLVTSALLSARQGHTASFFAATAGCALFAAVFLAVFALRMKTEFRGEILSDAATAVAKPKKPLASARRPSSTAAPLTVAPLAAASITPRTFGLAPAVTNQFGKEMLYVRRNQGILFALVMPMAIAVFLCIKWSTRSSASWIFPAAVAYTLMGLVALSYNSWGLEGPGSQLYFLAPVRIRDIMLGKNLMNFALASLEIVAMLAVVTYTGHQPPITIILASLLWAAGTLLFSTALGNQRSLASPKKINLASTTRKQTSSLSGLISLGVMLVAIGFGVAVFSAALFFHLQWILLPLFAAFAAGGFWVYQRILASIDRFALANREQLFLELCKPD